MTRIGTFAHNQVLLQTLNRHQRDMALSQTQVSTGLKSTTYEGLAADSSALLASKNVVNKMESFESSNLEVNQRLELYNNSLGELAQVGQDLRDSIMNAINVNSPLGFAQKIDQLFERATNALNTKFNGRYIYAGSRTDTAPVSVTDGAAFAALASHTTIFENDDTNLTINIDENQDLTYGVLADDAGGELMEALHRIMQFINGTLPAGAAAFAPAGPLNNPLTGEQRAFLINELSFADDAIAQSRAEEAENGVKLQNLQSVITRQRDQVVFMKTFISEIEDVDIAEAISNLNNDQTSLQAALNVLSRVNQISLLNFI